MFALRSSHCAQICPVLLRTGSGKFVRLHAGRLVVVEYPKFMAARGIVMPLHVHNKAPISVIISPFMSWLKASSRPRHTRLLCTNQPPGIDMVKYTEKFAQRMAMAGIEPHHRLALAVSGGPDSIALCVLTAAWKHGKFDAADKQKNKPINGLLAIIVDHGLRAESAEEASLVYNRVLDMGIKCVVSRCEWLDGRPKPGRLQEAARNKRYETLQNMCIQQKISILLIAHHTDDQAELFILRLSRNSGILGLAGMAFVSQVFGEFPDFNGKRSNSNCILLMRPLLEFTKDDMYDICRRSNQQWVEDPTNKSPLYVRNRIRMSLSNLSSSIFKAELQSVISACRRTRMNVHKFCHQLLKHAVTIMPHGYAVIDLENLRSMKVKDIYFTKFVASLTQFVSQRHKPVRGSASKLLMGYLRNFPCKTSLDVAGCYLCPAPGSKGTKVLVCCSIDSSMPITMKPCVQGRCCSDTRDIAHIVTYSEAYCDTHSPDLSSVPFLDATSSESVLDEAKKLGIISNSTYRELISLKREELNNFRRKTDVVPEEHARPSCTTLDESICPGQVAYFMNRFVLDWKICDTVVSYERQVEGRCFCDSRFIDNEMVARVRHMADDDWIYLLNLLKTNRVDFGVKERMIDYGVLSARRALVSLKTIPVAARRSMPVLVDSEGVLLCIPSIGFSQCPHLMVSAVFSPRIPLGGGHSSFL